MNNNMEYKGYLGSVEFSEEEAVFFGKIMNIRLLISYEGKNVMELSEQFREAVDEYSSICEQQ
ncbi:MAG: antitoxin HicB [Agathobacter rectalis]|jgi:predicted HicB family RNase H-like nuclease